MSPVEGKVVEVDGNYGGDGSHIQEGFEWQFKRGSRIYPGNDPKWIKLNWQTEFHGTVDRMKLAAEKRSDCSGKIRTAAQQFRGGS